MTLEEVKELVIAMESKGLIWDKFDEIKNSNNIKEIEELFKRYHSRLVYSILFENKLNDLPLWVNTNDLWLNFLVEWKLKGN